VRCTQGSPLERVVDTEVPTPRNLALTLYWLPEKRKQKGMLSPRKQLFHQQSVQPGKAFLIRQFWAGKEGSTSTPLIPLMSETRRQENII